MAVSLPFTLLDGHTALATEVMANFNALVNGGSATAFPLTGNVDAAGFSISNINSINTLGTPLNSASGGTGRANPTLHAIQVGASTAAMTQLTLGTAHGLLHGNAVGDPTFGPVDLVTETTGILQTTAGGTGVAYFTVLGPTAARNYTFPDEDSSIGFRGIPINTQSAGYTAVLTDNGKAILHPTTDNNTRTFTIPSNATTAFPIGAAITFINEINTLTIAITTDTLEFAGSGGSGSRTLSAFGMATAVKTAATRWMIIGTNLS